MGKKYTTTSKKAHTTSPTTTPTPQTSGHTMGYITPSSSPFAPNSSPVPDLIPNAHLVEWMYAVQKFYNSIPVNTPIFSLKPKSNIFVKNKPYTNLGSALFDVFLNSLDEPNRKFHTCSLCRDFFTKAASYCILTVEGRPQFPLLSVSVSSTNRYRNSMEEMQKYINARSASFRDPSCFAQLFGENNDLRVGIAESGGFTHFSYVLPDYLKNVSEAQSGALFDDLTYTIAFLKPLSAYATKLNDALQNPNLLRPELLKESYNHFVHLISHLNMPGRVTYSAAGIATSSSNYLRILNYLAKNPGARTIRSNVFSQFVQDYVAGKEWLKLHNDRVNPTVYQRPTAPAKPQAIDRANKKAEKEGWRLALTRRFANRSDFEKYAPHVIRTGSRIKAAPVTTPLFGPSVSIYPSLDKNKEAFNEALKVYRWARFIPEFHKALNAVLASSTHALIQFNSIARLSFFTMPIDSNAPSIFHWDSPKQRNPLGSYAFTEGLRVQGPPLNFEILGIGPDFRSHEIDKFLLYLSIPANSSLPKYVTQNTHLGVFPEYLSAPMKPHARVIEEYCNTYSLSATNTSQILCFLPVSAHEHVGTSIMLRSPGGTEHNIFLEIRK